MKQRHRAVALALMIACCSQAGCGAPANEQDFTAGGGPPVHVALLSIDGRRVFARMEHAPREGEPLEQVLAGQKVKLLVKDDGDHYFQILRGRGPDLGQFVQAIRRRVGGSG